MSMASAGLGEKGDMFLSGATADREKEPRGGEGKTSSVRPGRLSPPGVWGGWVTHRAQQAGGPGDVPPTVSNLLVSTTIMVTPWPEASYLGMINGWGRSHMCLLRFGALPNIERVEVLLQDQSVCSLRRCGARLWEKESTLQYVRYLIWSGTAGRQTTGRQIKPQFL